MINLVITDDHKILRQGIIKLLKNLGDYNILAELNDGEELLRNFGTLKEKADLFILDHSLPKKSGIEILTELQSILNEEKFLILTQNDSVNIKSQFYKLGARGFLSKTCTGEELKEAIEQIINTGYFNLQENIKMLRKNDPDFSPIFFLSKKELELIKWICCEEEYTYEQIASKMNISIKTVDYYRNNLFEKFNISSKTGLVLLSHKHKLTPPFL
ncbi:response regulator transcription factor [Epilithonimonas arachidiradicis]|uniref:DNA-binding response regulator n=1 Tax=Epilithonimonas arachidiradicis TaxID=1617282 RepID=A0A420CXH5_9FLAO|nr:response regulator transcription factor [Epilithonimonas arachidiradicis]RKE83184.1 LuxR family two component transcriptional regulator [Epilithonimonas arachidiradicis]GGG65544.1 DNA-binding response regulator [Epilithonimonas arachidiradicis]